MRFSDEEILDGLFFELSDEEILDELFFEHLEKKLPEKEVEFLRDLLDEGWDVPVKLNVGIMN